MLVGIDPGCSGCIVLLTNAGEYVDHLLMPILQVGKSKRVNAAAVADFLKSLDEELVAAVELVASMPKQGVSSTFTFGHAAGVVEGVLGACGIPVTHVTPQAWKKGVGLIGTDKDASRSRAVLMYPKLRALDKKGAGQALADAIWIARTLMQ